ncbi:MAG: hypothetical protein AAFP97_11980 [Pseudomonadota bacterium]
MNDIQNTRPETSPPQALGLRHWLLAAFLLTGAFGQFLAGFLPRSLGWGQTISTRASETEVFLIPGGAAFVIWLVLFFGVIGYAVSVLRPSNLRRPSLRPIMAWAGVAFWANAVRSLYQPLFGPDWISLLLFILILIPLLLASRLIVSEGFSRRSDRLRHLPVLAQAGWISAALGAAITQAAAFEAWNPLGLSMSGSALLTLLILTPLLLAIIWRLGSVAYLSALLWGLAWVVAVNFMRGAEDVAYAAITTVVLCVLVFIATKSRFNNRLPSHT